MNESDQTCEATPTQIIRETFFDSNRAKSEGEWWAASLIEALEEKHKRAWDIIETPDTERDELKRQLSVAHQDYRELSDAAVRVTTERDELRRQLDEVKESQISIRCNRRNRDKTLPTWEEVNDFVAELYGDNKELKRQLAEGPVCGPCEHKRARAFLERQIAEGELIPLEVYIWWTEEEGMNIPVIGGMSLQEFAKRKAAQ